MKRPVTVVLAALVVGLGGCDKLPKIPFLGKKAPAASTTTGKLAVASKADTTKQPANPPAEQPAAKPAPPERAAPKVPLTDTPWTPVDTGTVNPGMTRDEVVAVWGVPAAERTDGSHTYLYFRNGCEVSCGTFDVVFLDSNKVVDAIVRGPGHTYSGVSSSPTARTPQDARPGSGPGQ